MIKALLKRGMRNRDIQFYFNRQDRPVNSGRITGIRAGSYGPGVPEANDAELETFLRTFTPAKVGAVLDESERPKRTIAEKASARFVQRNGAGWYLADGETFEQECKAQFDPRKMEPIVRTIAAMANNRGGFIFIGIEDAECRVTGMPNTAFQDTDIARIVDRTKVLLTPTPVFYKEVIEVGGLLVGVIFVERQNVRPVIVCRDASGLEDGTILFRYSGQSGKIKFGDLLDILRDRDRAVQKDLLASASRLSEIGADRALIVDTDKGEVDAGSKRIVIDRSLADQLEFIREGEFQERDGAPTLRLVGDVHAVNRRGRVVERIEGQALDAETVLLAYLGRERVRSPTQYVCISAKVQRQWLPLFYFIELAAIDLKTAIKTFEETGAVYRLSKQRALERLKGQRSAFEQPVGASVAVVAAIVANDLDGLRGKFTDSEIARGIRGLPDGFQPVQQLFELLKDLYVESRKDPSLRSAVYRASARLDELER
ncbi:ATP-binding protein [Martelella sp. AD-3]|uniref:AlbA family DNA-binding domain-containing protein n=1 Tax=Martelella sp. AD-3 TaxID=686597 RepID=UPI0009DD4235|nr:ATP-binding protein [Martelella sp. AD-3]